MFISVKKYYKFLVAAILLIALAGIFIYAKVLYNNADFGKTFGPKVVIAENRLHNMQDNFLLCAKLCNSDVKFLQSIVFPEVMRYNSLKDGVEAESLRTLYVQLGEGYANFSIGIFQMKPSFAQQVETKSNQLLSAAELKELQLNYNATTAEEIRKERVERLKDEDWQMIYLTAFVAICNKVYASKTFSSNTEKLQWYATVYNAGFDKTASFISKKIKEDNFYLSKNMPGKKFKYAAIAAWFYNKTAQ